MADIILDSLRLVKALLFYVFSGFSESSKSRLSVARHLLKYRFQKSMGSEYMRRLVHGSLMDLPLKRKGITYTLAVFGTREELETEIVQKEIKSGMTVVDLGANIGYYTLILARGVTPGGRVYAIEPFPENIDVLKRNIQINGYEKLVEFSQLAISDKLGKTELFIGTGDNVHSIIDHFGNKQGSIEVETMSLFDFQEGRLSFDFIRMDIEGAEVMVVDGMAEMFKKGHFPKIFFEVHTTGDITPDPKYVHMLSILHEAGYRSKYVVSAANKNALPDFATLGYTPEKVMDSGHALFTGIKPDDLMNIVPRRPKTTRAIYFEHV